MKIVTVPVKDRIVNGGKTIVVGVMDDNLIDGITFTGLPTGQDHVIVATVGNDGNGHLTEIANGTLPLTASLTHCPGKIAAQITCKKSTEIWHSEVFKIVVSDGLTIDEDTPVDSPTVQKLMKILDDVDGYLAKMDAYEKACKEYAEAADDSADTAAAKVTLAAAEVTKAKAEVTKSEAEVTKAKAEVTKAETEVAKAKNEVSNAAAEVVKAKAQADAAAQSATAAAGSKSQIDTEIAQFKVWETAQSEDIATKTAEAKSAKDDAVSAKNEAVVAKTGAESALTTIQQKLASGEFKGDKGDPGTPGVNGADGQDGADGADGVSPSVTVTDITGGHRVSITDADGTKTFDVPNGHNGSDASVTKTNVINALTGMTSSEQDNACEVLGALRDDCMQLVETIVLDGTETKLTRNWNLKAMRIATENVLPSDASANRVFKVTCKSGSTFLPITYYDSWKTSGYIIYDVYPRYGFWCSERTAAPSAGSYNEGSAYSTYDQRMRTVANCPYITTQEISFSVPPNSGGKIHIYGVLV